MPDKPTGSAAAAREIAAYEEEHYGKISPGYPGPNKSAEQQAIEAIIDKHCPEDKAVGKVLEAARNVVLFYHRAAITGETVDAVIKLEAAIAEYEANK